MQKLEQEQEQEQEQKQNSRVRSQEREPLRSKVSAGAIAKSRCENQARVDVSDGEELGEGAREPEIGGAGEICVERCNDKKKSHDGDVCEEGADVGRWGRRK